MADSKQLNYNYIRNTLSNNKLLANDGSLGLGVLVNNLAVPLTIDNIVNPNYQELYGNKMLTEAWKVGQDQTINVVSQTGTAATQVSIMTSGSQTVMGNTGGISILPDNGIMPLAALDRPVGGKYQAVTGTITVPNGTTNVTIVAITSGTNATASLNGTTVTYSLTGSRANQKVRAIISYDYPETQYKANVVFIIPSNVKKEDIAITTKPQTNPESTLVDGVLTVTYQHTNPNYEVIIEYPGEASEVTQADTILYGVLQHQVKLEKNTSYVLQIVNGCMQDGITTPKSNISNKLKQSSGYSTWSFDNYVFFKTKNNPSSSLDFIITAYGVAQGYSIYGKNSTGDLVQLRNFKAGAEAKVFLFKSDLPWVVDSNGKIVGLANEKLHHKEDIISSGLNPELSDTEIKNIFKEAPQLVISEDKSSIIVFPPDAVVSGDDYNWKWADLIGKTAESGQDTINNMKLLVYRDYLTTETRDLNNVQMSKNRGLLKTLQRTNRSPKDTYSTQTPDSGLKISFEIPQIIWKSKPTIKLPWSTNKQTITRTWSSKTPTIETTSANFSLPLASLLGYNREYSRSMNLASLGYQYTSIVFAWGCGEAISAFSTPVIIDRNLIESCSLSADNKSFIISPKKAKIEYRDDDYYDGITIFITAAEEESE